MAECIASAQDVADQLNRYREKTVPGIADVALCRSGCFNLEGWILHHVQRADTADRKWFAVGMGAPVYTAEMIMAAFPNARRDCPGQPAVDPLEDLTI